MRVPRRRQGFDVAVIGAGPVGCVAALACARRGRRVLLLEANPDGSKRLAGEWLHPPALAILEELGVSLPGVSAYASGSGFVVYPDDGSGPVVLPYGEGTKGFSGDHGALVDSLREHCRNEPGIDYVERARATAIDGQNLTYEGPGGNRTIVAESVVAASGRSVLFPSGEPQRRAGTYSRMAGVILDDCDLPFEGYGHVFLGGLGPCLAYRIDARRVRLCLDVPLALHVHAGIEAVLDEGYGAAMPPALRPAFRRALRAGAIAWASNQFRPRVSFGRPGLALVGDAVGFHHPLTAQGMTLGFQDAIAFARARSFAAYRRERLVGSRVPEMLAVSLYEVFADTSDEVVVIRRAIYDLWRGSALERKRTMRFLGCQDTGPVAFSSSFLKALLLASRGLVRQGRASWRWAEVAEVGSELSSRIRWLVGGALHLTSPIAEEKYGAALKASLAKADVVAHPSSSLPAEGVSPARALARGTRHLASSQRTDGAFEGEVVWCPMLAAQYVIACHIAGREIPAERRRRLLLHFERTRLPNGAWGLHEFLSEPYLFVTSLVYVAARLLGAGPDDPLLRGALAFLRAEGGVVAVPSWGKFWLAMLGLYAWEGVPPVLPEIWALPRWVPVHPSRLYCHTRMIYLAMAAIYAKRVVAPETALLAAIRDELYPQGFATVDFARARTALRREELVAAPGRTLRAIQRLSVAAEKVASHTRSASSIRKLHEHIRFELAATRFTSISPVSGLLNVIALHAADAQDEDARRALDALEAWIWEDDERGTRVAGARSASWDSALAAQALAAAAEHEPVGRELARADAFLAAQQIRVSWPDAARFHRTDPRGGYCFSEASHGWPVSDCTAEALLGRLALSEPPLTEDDAALALSFILRCRNGDGGFSAYEPRRLSFSLEWMNPAEMFADSMTEFSFVECTASCVAAIVAARRAFPSIGLRKDLRRLSEATAGGVAFLRVRQHRDGSWPGAWGVRLLYGTLFGVRGLVAAGVPPTDPALRKACAWLKSIQRPDGSWSERHVSDDPRIYTPGDEGQVTQTAWALSTLLTAEDPDWGAIDRAARFLASAQRDDGDWPSEKPSGIFFRTALLDYTLYKSYFPVWALAQYETRRKEREALMASEDEESSQSTVNSL
ncbi:MAG TPA: FAD-dependent oxidoreductase [Candidatus Polarisedimenticolaceae bacterium]|nr:FAD-dependent oxidoreductase [Candidatus Polarisedimenticolaceae bacterium]